MTSQPTLPEQPQHRAREPVNKARHGICYPGRSERNGERRSSVPRRIFLGSKTRNTYRRSTSWRQRHPMNEWSPLNRSPSAWLSLCEFTVNRLKTLAPVKSP